MSYVGGSFEYDLFVSYSHGDFDGDGQSLLKQWSQAFAKQLEEELKLSTELCHGLSIFLDEHQRPSRGVDPLLPLTTQLKDAIASSAMMAVLVSPHYLRSSWCRDERDWWQGSQVQRGVPLNGRIALAWIWPLCGQAELPALFVDERQQPHVGFLFYDKTKPTPKCRPYEWPAPSGTCGGPFREALLDLVGAISNRLTELKSTVVARQRAAEDAQKLASGARTVYLHGREDQAKAWEEANDALSHSGFAVAPGDPEPVEHDPLKLQNLRKARVEAINECDALLLLGSGDGRALDADLVGVGRNDRNSAKAISNRLLPCALIDTVGAPIATPQRRRFAGQLRVDWIDGTNSSWVPSIEQWLVAKGTSFLGER